MISKPRTALGGGLLAAVLLVSGCQARVGTAATVGDDRITTKTFTTTYNAAATSATADKASLQRQVLAELVQVQQARVLAKRLGLSTSAGQIDVALAQVKRGLDAQSQSLPDNLVRLAGELQALETNLGGYYVQHGGTPDQDQVSGFQVKDKATGQQVVAKVARDGSNLDKLAATYRSTPGTGTTLGTVGISQVPELAGLKPGESTLATVSDSSSGTVTAAYYVIHVDSQFDQKDLTTALSAVKVRINPRFGTWAQDASTGSFQVVPATSDIVAPGPSAAPSGSPASAPAPSAPAPSGAAPSAAAPAPSAAPVPSATAAPAPPAAPAPTAPPSAAASS